MTQSNSSNNNLLESYNYIRLYASTLLLIQEKLISKLEDGYMCTLRKSPEISYTYIDGRFSIFLERDNFTVHSMLIHIVDGFVGFRTFYNVILKFNITEILELYEIDPNPDLAYLTLNLGRLKQEFIDLDKKYYLDLLLENFIMNEKYD